MAKQLSEDVTVTRALLIELHNELLAQTQRQGKRTEAELVKVSELLRRAMFVASKGIKSQVSPANKTKN